MALPQDGQDANGLEKVTEIPAGKELMFIDPTTNAGGIITLENLTKQILNGLLSQTFKMDTGTQTIPAAINYLFGNTFLLSSPTKKLDDIDLNEVTVGIYTITDKCLNTPPILSRGTLIVSVPEVTGYVRQVYLGGYRNDIYSRVKYYNNITNKFEWRKWETIFSE